jgi:ABC-type multidrug transport system fused ATPase/permease subunit
LKATVEAKVAAKFIFEVIDRQSPIPLDDPKAESHILQGEIEFDNIDFFYPTRPEQYILKGFKATFAKGKTTAIVGPSGAGKSSIAQLIERFYEPETGKVLVDGKDLRSINLTHFRNQIGYVPQEPVLFNTSIKENIKMGKTDATDEEIEEALKASNAWDFCMEQPDKLNTYVGAGGNQLSGGQKQRLALARAFIKKPKMFIFDEATSALDKSNEKLVQASIDRIRQQLNGVTCVVIAHRLSTIRDADKILVMGKGVIQETGTYDELIAMGGQFSRLV